jgi:hypothetical protein
MKLLSHCDEFCGLTMLHSTADHDTIEYRVEWKGCTSAGAIRI